MTRQVVCLAPSGAGMTYYRQWPATWGDCRFVPISLPGRDERFREPLAHTMADAVASLAGRLPAGPLALYGHSLGAAVAFELARALGGRATGLAVSGRQAPDAAPAVLVAVPAGGDDLRAVMSRLAAVPGPAPAGSVLAHVSDAFRADLELSLAYRWDGVGPLDIPVTAVSFGDDPVAGADAAIGWARTTADHLHHVELDGDHTTPFGAPTALLEAITGRCP